MESKEGALAGVRVLDLAHVIAGPFAATLLADMGADVVKVEAPGRGDGMRALGPREAGAGLWWRVGGRNKRSLELDLRVPRGRDALLRMAACADVVIESFRPGTLERWGLGPDALHAANPRLILLRISGYGQDDPGRRPGFGRVAEAMSGAIHLSGEPARAPMHPGFSLGDNATGLMGAFAVATALYARERTGRGEVIDLALFETLFRMIEWQLPIADRCGEAVQRQGNRFPLGYAVGGSFETADGRWITLSAATNRTILKILHAVGGEELACDPRYSTMEARAQERNLEAVYARVAEWVRERTAQEAIEQLRAVDVAVGRVYDAADILADETYLRRRLVLEVPDAELGVMRQPGIVPRLRNAPGSVRRLAPALGEHNEEVLRELAGLDADEIAALYEEVERAAAGSSQRA